MRLGRRSSLIYKTGFTPRKAVILECRRVTARLVYTPSTLLTKLAGTWWKQSPARETMPLKIHQQNLFFTTQCVELSLAHA
jgi:hypothetical protein